MRHVGHQFSVQCFLSTRFQSQNWSRRIRGIAEVPALVALRTDFEQHISRSPNRHPHTRSARPHGIPVARTRGRCVRDPTHKESFHGLASLTVRTFMISPEGFCPILRTTRAVGNSGVRLTVFILFALSLSCQYPPNCLSANTPIFPIGERISNSPFAFVSVPQEVSSPFGLAIRVQRCAPAIGSPSWLVTTPIIRPSGWPVGGGSIPG
jgi:hypothetical protein